MSGAQVVTAGWASQYGSSSFHMEDQVRRCLYMSGWDPNASLPGARLDGINKGLRYDSSQTAFFARQLEYIYTQTYDIKYPELKARQLVPVDTRVPNGAEFFTYRSFEKQGLAKVIHSYADDFPKASVKASEFQQRVVGLGASYGYSVQDMRAAAFAGVPLEAREAEAARWALESLLEELAATGDASGKVLQPDGTTAFYGFANAPNILQTTKVSPAGTWAAQIAAGVAGGTLTAVAQAIAQDVLNMYTNVFNTTKGVHIPNTLLLPTNSYSALLTQPRAPGFTDDTILGFLMKLLAPHGLQQITWWNRLDTAGSGAVGRAMLYEKSQENEGLIISQEFEQFPPQPKGMTWMIPCHMRTGAVEVRYPKSVTYMDGVA